jgi:hypothetical protein
VLAVAGAPGPLFGFWMYRPDAAGLAGQPTTPAKEIGL